MGKKAVFIFLLLILSLSLVSASFPKSHIGHILKGFSEIDSPITRMCKPYLAEFIDGESSMDVPVLHYGDELVTSYISTHTQSSGYEACLKEVGSSTAKKCFCLGGGAHIEEDRWSHLEEGYTVNCLKKYIGSNYFNHMSCEVSFENKLVAKWTAENEEIITSGDLDYYNSIFLNSLFTADGKPSEYLDLLNTASGIDMTNDAKIVRSGYQGEGFYTTVYSSKIRLPWWAYGVSIGFIIFGLGMALLLFFLGKSGWKWVSIFIWGLVFLLGVLILFSFITGTTWKITNILVEFPTKFGIYSISDNDVEYYDKQIQNSINNFLKTGKLTVEDATGLEFVDSQGILHKGSLTKAERPFKIIWYAIILPLFTLLNLLLVWKSLKPKKQKQ